MQVLLLIVRTESRFYSVLALLTAATVFVTPVMWGIDFWAVFSPLLGSYMNGLHYSLFPLFPWSAFVFSGGITGYFYLQSRHSASEQGSAGKDERMMTWVIWSGVAFMALSFVIEPLAASLYPTYDYWRYSPSFFMLRLGLVLLLCATMFYFEKRKGVSPGSVITLIGRESLIVYVVHLLLIFGDFGPFNFKQAVASSFGYVEAAIATILLLIIMYALAFFWGKIKREYPRLKVTLSLGTLLVAVLLFFFGPGTEVVRGGGSLWPLEVADQIS